MTALGCGTYRVAIHTRASLLRAVVEVPWTQIEWGRVLDDTSSATVQAGAGCCGEILESQVRPWSHTLAIYRKVQGSVGYGRVWSGPVMAIRDRDALTLEARDLSAWCDHRLVHDDHDHVAEDLADIYQSLWDDAMAPDPVPDYTLSLTASGTTGDRQVLTDSHTLAGDPLRELGRTGLDWTVLDRVQIVGPSEIDTPAVATLIDSHFVGDPEVVVDGSTQANLWYVSGSGGGAEGDEVSGFASVSPGADGLLESVASESSILDDLSADENAQTRLDRSSMPQRYVTDADLHSDAPVPMERLIPGARVRLALTGRCLPVRTTERLSSVKVTASRDGNAVTEKVSISLQPLGTTEDG